METKELRIGNLVFGTEQFPNRQRINHVCEVIALDGDENQLSAPIIVKNHDAESEFDVEFCDELTPITLDKDWLSYCGFTRMEESIWYNYQSRKLFQLSEHGSLFKLWTGNGTIGTVIEYVHQLQNLYFVLTGEELTITP